MSAALSANVGAIVGGADKVVNLSGKIVSNVDLGERCSLLQLWRSKASGPKFQYKL
jgi:hypothetical protein